LQAAYGKTIFSGQTSSSYDDLVKKVQRNPVVRGFDMQNYSPHNPYYNWQPIDDGTVASAINWYQKTNRKGIVTFHWHWFSPTGGIVRTNTFYTNNTNFDVKKAVTSGTE
jgi:mannan endo-1,4-beta-mannosidase